jgi:hypothetical protein
LLKVNSQPLVDSATDKTFYTPLRLEVTPLRLDRLEVTTTVHQPSMMVNLECLHKIKFHRNKSRDARESQLFREGQKSRVKITP